jgi:hypothetical protein
MRALTPAENRRFRPVLKHVHAKNASPARDQVFMDTIAYCLGDEPTLPPSALKDIAFSVDDFAKTLQPLGKWDDVDRRVASFLCQLREGKNRLYLMCANALTARPKDDVFSDLRDVLLANGVTEKELFSEMFLQYQCVDGKGRSTAYGRWIVGIARTRFDEVWACYSRQGPSKALLKAMADVDRAFFVAKMRTLTLNDDEKRELGPLLVKADDASTFGPALAQAKKEHNVAPLLKNARAIEKAHPGVLRNLVRESLKYHRSVIDPEPREKMVDWLLATYGKEAIADLADWGEENIAWRQTHFSTLVKRLGIDAAPLLMAELQPAATENAIYGIARDRYVVFLLGLVAKLGVPKDLPATLDKAWKGDARVRRAIAQKLSGKIIPTPQGWALDAYADELFVQIVDAFDCPSKPIKELWIHTPQGPMQPQLLVLRLQGAKEQIYTLDEPSNPNLAFLSDEDERDRSLSKIARGLSWGDSATLPSLLLHWQMACLAERLAAAFKKKKATFTADAKIGVLLDDEPYTRQELEASARQAMAKCKANVGEALLKHAFVDAQRGSALGA